MSLNAAAEAFREAIRETVKRYALWYLIEGVLLVVVGLLAIIYPVITSAAVVVLLGWLLIISGVLQGMHRRAPRAAFLAAAHLRHPRRPRRLALSPRSGTGNADDCAAADCLFHDGGHFEGCFRANNPAFPQLGLGACKRSSRHSAGADPMGEPAGNSCVVDRASARYQSNQRRRRDRLPRMACAEDLISVSEGEHSN